MYQYLCVHTRIVVLSSVPSSHCTSRMLSFVGEQESAHTKLEACTALRSILCGLHTYIYTYKYIEKIACSHH